MKGDYMEELKQVYLDFWIRWQDSSGTSNRKEYWYVILINIAIGAVLGAVSVDLSSLYSLVAFVPGITLAVRRLNDVGKSYSSLFWIFVPFFGAIYLIYLLAQPSK